MDAWDLQVFGVVAREGGMTKAARLLHTVQSNVTKRIRLLEEELGTTLFHRQKKGVSLTTAGEQLLPYAEKIQRLLSEAKGTLTKSLAPKGPLRIGATETSVAMRLAPLFTLYGKSYPEWSCPLKQTPPEHWWSMFWSIDWKAPLSPGRSTTRK